MEMVQIIENVDIILAIEEMLQKEDKFNFYKINKFVKDQFFENVRYIRISPLVDESPNDEIIFSKFKGLTRLELFRIEENGLALLNKDNFRNLTDLSLITQDDILDFTPLVNLKSIRKLEVYTPNLTNISFLEMDNFSELRELNLEGINKLNEHFSLTKLKKLTKLNLYDNELKDISYINNSYFPCLTELNIGANPNIESFECLSKIQTLKILIISSNNLNNISFLEASKISGPFNLISLDLTQNDEIKDYSPIKTLVNLERLYLCKNKLPDLKFLSLDNLKKLKELRLDECQFPKEENAESLEKLRKVLGNNLHYVEITE